MDNYFKIDDLGIEYPIHLTINGRKWNFKAEYQKKLKEIEKSRNVVDLLIDTKYFLDFKVYRSIPFIVTDDIKVKGDKKRYYIADYFFPNYNLVVMNNMEGSTKNKYMEKTMNNLGYDFIELPILKLGETDYHELLRYVNGFRTSLRFRTVPPSLILPKYFE